MNECEDCDRLDCRERGCIAPMGVVVSSDSESFGDKTYIKIKTKLIYEMEYFINTKDVDETSIGNVEYFQHIIDSGKYLEISQKFVDEAISEISLANEEEAIEALLLDNPYISDLSREQMLHIINKEKIINEN